LRKVDASSPSEALAAARKKEFFRVEKMLLDYEAVDEDT
jgi:hypothetical protein